MHEAPTCGGGEDERHGGTEGRLAPALHCSSCGGCETSGSSGRWDSNHSMPLWSSAINQARRICHQAHPPTGQNSMWGRVTKQKKKKWISTIKKIFSISAVSFPFAVILTSFSPVDRFLFPSIKFTDFTVQSAPKSTLIEPSHEHAIFHRLQGSGERSPQAEHHHQAGPDHRRLRLRPGDGVGSMWNR